MSYSYDRSASEMGPIRIVLDDYWNRLHDLEYALGAVSQDYDRAAVYAGGPGQKDAEKLVKAIHDAVKTLEKITMGDNAVFSKLVKAENDFIKKHGTPEDYVRKQQDQMGLR